VPGGTACAPPATKKPRSALLPLLSALPPRPHPLAIRSNLRPRKLETGAPLQFPREVFFSFRCPCPASGPPALRGTAFTTFDCLYAHAHYIGAAGGSNRLTISLSVITPSTFLVVGSTHTTLLTSGTASVSSTSSS